MRTHESSHDRLRSLFQTAVLQAVTTNQQVMFITLVMYSEVGSPKLNNLHHSHDILAFSVKIIISSKLTLLLDFQNSKISSILKLHHQY